jgi:hypothetical protein
MKLDGQGSTPDVKRSTEDHGAGRCEPRGAGPADLSVASENLRSLANSVRYRVCNIVNCFRLLEKTLRR